jgi:uncharacterized membrane protein YgaE (UPF0421/DUF939 family)
VTTEKIMGLAAFVLRCTAAAILAYFLAGALGLPHPLWACIFALIASQGQTATTWTTIGGRVVGTIFGVIVAIAVGTVLKGAGLVVQTAVAVAICAVFAWERPAVQLCLWTPPIVLMSMTPTESVVHAGFVRGCEVILGALVGGLLLFGAERISARTHRVHLRDDGGS